MADRIDGLKAIGAELERIWKRVNVSESSVCKYMTRAWDPLPHTQVVTRISVDKDELAAWAQRQVRRQEPQPEQSSRQQDLFQDGKERQDGKELQNKKTKEG